MRDCEVVEKDGSHQREEVEAYVGPEGSVRFLRPDAGEDDGGEGGGREDYEEEEEFGRSVGFWSGEKRDWRVGFDHFWR